MWQKTVIGFWVWGHRKLSRGKEMFYFLIEVLNISVYTCQNSLKWTLKIYELHFMWIVPVVLKKGTHSDIYQNPKEMMYQHRKKASFKYSIKIL